MEPHDSRQREPDRNAGALHRMSGNNYSYYYPQSNAPYPQKQWSEWVVEQHQYNNSTAFPRSNFSESVTSNYPNSHIPPRGPYYPYTPQNNTRPFHGQRRYNNTNHQYSPNQPNWNRNNSYKRTRLDSDEPSEPKSKASKKKKKPLSQNVPSKKDWTFTDAERALNCEKEYNKRHKNQSLIIKFPDLELNKEIVSKFHNSIENVHFQQPSTARFCFVTLEESADANTVITALNKIKFGDGFLTAEYKKDREEDQNIGPNDIDPHTLYVGNLAQEITKEDMVKTYPKCKRIDIGYAKKMKYTRYAFVTFKSVQDSIEAFKKTHSTQMYSKSLIVRFRRLHGTVGMPGESKQQNPPKNKDGNPGEEVNATSSDHDNNHIEHEPIQIEDENNHIRHEPIQIEDDHNHIAQVPSNAKDTTTKEKDPDVNLTLVKTEPDSSGEEEDGEHNICDITEHRPIKVEVKNEPYDEEGFKDMDVMEVQKKEVDDIKEEMDDDEEDNDDQLYVENDSSDDDEEDDDGHDDEFDTEINFDAMYTNMVAQANNVNSLGNTNP